MADWVKKRMDSAKLGLSAMLECAESSPHVHLTFISTVEDQDHFVLTSGSEAYYREFLKEIDAAVITIRGAATLLGFLSFYGVKNKRFLRVVLSSARRAESGMTYLGGPISSSSLLPGSEEIVEDALELLIENGLVIEKSGDYYRTEREE